MDLARPTLDIMSYLWIPIARQISYIRNFKENTEKLNKEMDELLARRNDVRRKINANMVEMIPTDGCQYWLKAVQDIENQVKAIQEEVEAEVKCLLGLFPDVYGRMKLGKHIIAMVNMISSHKEKYILLEEVTDAPVVQIEPKPALEVEANISTKRTLQKIMECVRDERTKRIGIWGMAGVGKTTIMRQLNNHSETTQMFDIVIWVSVSSNYNRQKVQHEIARRLGLNSSNNDSGDRLAARIYQNLTAKTFLLLLDDVWKHIDFSDLGIPNLNEKSRCKVVLTTRFLNVCNQMKTDREIHVDVLCEQEAWNLFCASVGDVVTSSSIEPVARDVARECDGLPLAVIVVGSSLRKEHDVCVWRNALKKLRSSSTTHMIAVQERVFQPLKFSFEQLKDEGIKNCFLYCALYPEDFEIETAELIEYWIAEGFFNDELSLSEARDDGHSILKVLIEASLLERCESRENVKMHDVIRDLAIRITNSNGEGCKFLVKAGVRLEDPPKQDNWRERKRISLMKNELSSLLEVPKCPKLLTLLLQGNRKLTLISKLFFEQMDALRVLDLSCTNIKSLPQSVCNLTNIRGLYLKDCGHLVGLPHEIGAFKCLEILCIIGNSKIKSLPTALMQLTQLRRLLVTFCNKYVTNNGTNGLEDEKLTSTKYKDKLRNTKINIPTGIISKLPLLEELGMHVHLGNDLRHWDDETLIKVVQEELGSLRHLNYLDFYFPSVDCLELFMRRSRPWREKRLMRFRFRVGNSKLSAPLLQWKHEIDDRCLIYRGGDKITHTAIGEVLDCSCLFILDGHKSAQRFSEFGVIHMNGLKSCDIIGRNEMVTIIDDYDGFRTDNNGAIMPNLEEFYVRRLLKLRSFWKGLMPPGSLARLRRLYLIYCPNLRNAFSSLDIISQLSNLELIHIEDCSSMEAIIDVEEDMIVPHVDRLVLPKLKTLYLYTIQELVGICKGYMLRCPSLAEIVILECPKIKSLSSIANSSNGTPNLEWIKGERQWWEALEWEDNAIKKRLQPLFLPLP